MACSPQSFHGLNITQSMAISFLLLLPTVGLKVKLNSNTSDTVEKYQFAPRHRVFMKKEYYKNQNRSIRLLNLRNWLLRARERS